MPRPKKPPGQLRDNTLRIRLTEAEREAIDAAAQAKGLDSSTWARSELLGLVMRVAGKRHGKAGGTAPDGVGGDS